MAAGGRKTNSTINMWWGGTEELQSFNHLLDEGIVLAPVTVALVCDFAAVNVLSYFQTYLALNSWRVNVCAIFRRFKFLPMVEASRLLIYNTPDVHTDIMLPWIQCSLTHDCILPIGKTI